MRLSRIVATCLVAVTAGMAAAADLAVIVRNQNYTALSDVNSGVDLTRLRQSLSGAGFDVVMIRNAEASEMRRQFSQLGRDMEEADRLIIFAAGHVVTNRHESWLLGTDSGRVNAFGAGANGLPLSTLDRFLAAKPGSALLLVASPGTGRPGAGLELGYLPGDNIPQGVTVIAGRGQSLTEILVTDILEQSLPVGRALENRGGRTVGYGFLPKLVTFMPPARAERRGAEQEAWETARREDTERGYEAYLSRFPNGANAAAAEARLDDLRLSPAARAARAEADLGLGRDDRRALQRYLSILGYDPRGIDGIFGRGTRAAIGNWQSDERFQPTGYLTGNQVERLRQRGQERQAALENEARRRQEEGDRQDTAYWRETGSGSTGQGMRRYLARYPDGLFSELARNRLAALEEERRGQVARAEREIWEETRRADTEAAYQRYLSNYPNGAFAENAKARVLELRQGQSREERAAEARAAEQRVLVNPITRLLVERRLNQLGLKPGKPDGEFDKATRKAIRNFQRARNLPVTGFVNQATLVRLLAG